MKIFNRLFWNVYKHIVCFLMCIFPMYGFSQFANSDSCICYGLIYSYLRINIENFNEIQIYQCGHGFGKCLFGMNQVRVIEPKRYIVKSILQGTNFYFTFYINTLNNNCLLLSYGREPWEKIYMKGIKEFYKIEKLYIERLQVIERQSLIFDIILQSSMQAFIVDSTDEIIELNRSLFVRSCGILTKDSLSKMIKFINFKPENKKNISYTIVYDNSKIFFSNERKQNIFFGVFVVVTGNSGRSILTPTFVWHYDNNYLVKRHKKLNYILGDFSHMVLGPRVKIFNEWI